mgnify:CR=1 FL=1|jgi:Uma2 family endonuclease/antitoxin (DNA-binding transcriptional repressor) of toxin-antitoxin stability system
MIVNATDLKNNLGKYLRLSATEDIIVSSNGRKIARLSAFGDSEAQSADQSKVMYELSEENSTHSLCAEDEKTYIFEKARDYSSFPRKATYEEFLALVADCDEHAQYEYIDGEIYLLASPRVSHQKVLGRVYGLFFNWFDNKKCSPLSSPFDITLKRDNGNINVVQPDLIVICDLEEKTNERDYYMGIPTLAVEVLSDSTRRKDCVKKLDLYMSTGIKEYWVINPSNKEITVYLFADNVFSQSITYRNDEVAASILFEGLQVPLAKLFA